MEIVNARGLHPVSDESAVINLSHKLAENNEQPVIYASLMLWKESGKKWTDEELVPVKRISRSKKGNSITVSFNDGSRKTLEFLERFPAAQQIHLLRQQ